MNKEEAVAKIAQLVAQAESAIAEAEALADEHSLDFEFSPAYGMGGTYYGEGHQYIGRFQDKGLESFQPKLLTILQGEHMSTTITISRAKYEELLSASGKEIMSIREGNQKIAEKVEGIKTLLREIKEVCELSGATVKLEYEFSDLIDEVGQLNADWNSSSYNC